MKLVTNIRETLYDLASIRESKESKIKRTIKEFVKLFIFRYSLFGEEHEFLFVNTVKREDHSTFFNKIYDLCNYDKGFLIWTRKKCINFRNILNCIIYIPSFKELNEICIPEDSQLYDPHNQYIKICYLDKLALYYRLITNIDMKRVANEYNWGKSKHLVVLFDIGEPEHFLVNAANSHNINTITASHGVFPPGFNHLIRGNYNQWNAPSKYIIAWGKSTSDLFLQYSPGINPIICGTVHISPKDFIPDTSTIGIVCEIHAYAEYNQKMIDIAETYARNYGKKVHIRLHPGDDEKNYKIDSDVSAFYRDIDNAYIIVACMSTMLFTYIAQGRRVLRFNDIKEFFFDIPETISFKDIESFSSKANNIENIDYKAISRYYIDSIGEKAAEKYASFFDDMHSTFSA